jgi:hypothetical protein
MLDDRFLPQELLIHIDSLPFRIIASILFESGAYFNDVKNLTVGELRANCGNENGAILTSTNSRHRMPRLTWSSETGRLLRHYCDSERLYIDLNHRCFDELNDSDFVFINQAGNQISHTSFYKVWNNACQKSGLKIRPYQTRHLFISKFLKLILKIEDARERERLRVSFIQYLGIQSATLSVYTRLSIPELDILSLINRTRSTQPPKTQKTQEISEDLSKEVNHLLHESDEEANEINKLLDDDGHEQK